MFKQLAGIILALLVALAFAVGCGGDGDTDAGAVGGPESAGGVTGETASDEEGGTAEGPAPSKSSYVKQLNVICAREKNALVSRLVEHSKQTEVDADELFASATEQVLAPAFEARLGEVRDLGAPEGDEQEIDALLGAMEQAARSLSEEPPKNIQQYSDVLRRSNELAVEYGADACGGDQ